MTQDLGNITLIPNILNYFRTASTGLEGVLIGNESGYTCSITMGTRSPKNLLPGNVDFFPIDNQYNGIIQVNPKSVLSTANLYPSNQMYFEAVGYNEGFNAASYPMPLPRNTTGAFAGTQSAYNIVTFGFGNFSGFQTFVIPPIPANFQASGLVLSGSNTFGFNAQIPGSFGEMAQNTSGGTEVSTTQITPATSTTGWIEITNNASTQTVNANIPNQSGNGWTPDTLPQGTLGTIAGNWSASIGMTYGLSATAFMTLRISTYNAITGQFTTIGTIPISGQAISAARANFAFPATAFPSIALPSGTYLYFDLFLKLTGNWNVADKVTIFLNNNGIHGIANDMQVNTPGINIPTTGSLSSGNSKYTQQMSTYFGGIELDLIQAISKTQLTVNVSNIDSTLAMFTNGENSIQWRSSVAVAGNLNLERLFFNQPFKSNTGQQLAVSIFQDSGTEFITGQMYYYVQ